MFEISTKALEKIKGIMTEKGKDDLVLRVAIRGRDHD